jgi:phytoene synthase
MVSYGQADSQSTRGPGRQVGGGRQLPAPGDLPVGANRVTTRGMNDQIAALVRRHDPDRFLTALFAPADRRDALLTLYAFNHELARAREMVSEPPLALIRLQWWREVLAGERRRHEVATPLSEALAAGALQPTLLLPLIESREAEAYGDFATQAEWHSWLLAGAGGLAVAAAAALGAGAPESFRPFGAAYGVAGLLRSSLILAAQGRCLLPHDLLARHNLSPEGFHSRSRPSIGGHAGAGGAGRNRSGRLGPADRGKPGRGAPLGDRRRVAGRAGRTRPATVAGSVGGARVRRSASGHLHRSDRSWPDRFGPEALRGSGKPLHRAPAPPRCCLAVSGVARAAHALALGAI